MRNWKKFLVFILAIAMVVSSVPFTASAAQQSFDEIEIEQYLKPGPSPMDAPAEAKPTLEQGSLAKPGADSILLDGVWEMVEGGEEADRLNNLTTSATSTAAESSPELAFDGNWASDSEGWVAAANGQQTLTIDFGTKQSVNSAAINFGDQPAASFALEGSNGNGSWTPIWEVADNQDTEIDYTFPSDANYQAYRLVVTPQEGSVAVVRELQLLYTALEPINIALNKPTLADSTFTGFPAGNAVDGQWASEADEWVSGPDPSAPPVVDHWLQIDLGAVEQIDSFVIYHLGMAYSSDLDGVYNDLNTRDFRMEVRNTEEDEWVSVWEVEGNTKNASTKVFDQPIEARYVRLYITKPAETNPNCRIVEVFVNQDKPITTNVSEHAPGKSWAGSIDAAVPGSIHTALFDAGVIPDPYVSRNDAIAQEQSLKTWWLKTTFEYNGDGKNVQLNFEGVCDRANFYLNGQKIGFHQGMFGGPYLDITDVVEQGTNTLVVQLLPAIQWEQTVVFNCTYGWHYAKIWPLGIWNSVSVEDVPEVVVDSPFIVTQDAQAGLMDLSVDLLSEGTIDGIMNVTVSPKNFVGNSYSFAYPVSKEEAGDANVRLEFNIPDPQLWWPNNYGDQNLYWLEVSFEDGEGNVLDYAKSSFGIRTIEMGPGPDGPNPGLYNWTPIINDKPLFLTGAGWCAPDALMRLDPDQYDTYDRILSRAHEQGVQFFRAWGGGFPETDDFYDFTDEYGICIYQEWPTCWDSFKTQPAEVLYETVILNTKRLRNRASLIMWCGGNEGVGDVNDPVLNNIGKLTMEYDGTRAFHRQDGRGSTHDHIHWSAATPDNFVGMYANMNINLTEYGLQCMPNKESILKYATEEEFNQWPIDPTGTIAYHTPTFNQNINQAGIVGDINIELEFAKDIMDVKNLDDMILATQINQMLATRPMIDNSRANWPNVQVVAYYKMNGPYPAASWDVIDWYGSPKLAHWFLQDANAPLTAACKLDRLNTFNKADQSLSTEIHLFDIANELEGKDWEVQVRAYNETFDLIKDASYEGSGSYGLNHTLGEFTLTAEQTNTAPLFLVVDTVVEGELEARNYYFLNYAKEQDCLFNLPRAHVEYTVEGNVYTITNTSDIPAFAVHFECDNLNTFKPSDNYFWLEPGETKTVTVNSTEGVTGITSWNMADAEDVTPPSAPANLKAEAVDSLSIDVSWDASEDDTEIVGYYLYRNDEQVTFVKGGKTAYTDTGLDELTTYTYAVQALDNGGNISPISQSVQGTTLADLRKPILLSAHQIDATSIRLMFSREVGAESAENIANYTLSNDATVLSAALQEDGQTVVLTTSTLAEDVDYTISASNVKDTTKTQNVMDPTTLTLSDPSLAAHWKLDEGEGNVVRDSTGNHMDGKGVELQWQEGKIDGSVYIDGTTNTPIIIENSDMNLGNNFTLSTWIKQDALTTNNYHVILAKGPKSAGHFELYTEGGNLALYAPDLGTFKTSISLVEDKEWHHIAVTLANGQIKFYWDGALAFEQGVSGSLADMDSNIAIGSQIDKSMVFSGNIDDVRIYTTGLSADDIAELAGADPSRVSGVSLDQQRLNLAPEETAQLTATVRPDTATNKDVTWASSDPAVATVDNGLVTAVATGRTTITVTTEDGNFIATCTVVVQEEDTDSLVAYYPMDEGEGTVISDVTKLNEDGSAANPNWTEGVIGKALSFGSADQVVAIPNADINANGDFSIAFWAQSNNPNISQPQVLFAKDQKSSNNHFEFYFGPNGLRIYSPAAGVGDNGWYSTFTDTEWHHIALVGEGGQISLYLDGVKDDLTINASALPESINNLYLGGLAPGDEPPFYFDGQLDDFRVYSIALAQDQIDELVAMGSGDVVPVESVSLDKETAELEEGASLTLVATVAPDNATNKNVTWVSSDDEVATVDQTGKVTAVKAGEATITVTTEDGQKTDTCVVTVKEKAPVTVPVESVSLDKESAELFEGNTLTLTATVAPDNATNKNVTWSSSDDEVATVDATGKVTAVKAGEATITVTTEDGQKTDTCVVTVKEKPSVEVPVEKLKISPYSVRVFVGEELDLNVEVTPANATIQDVTWVSENPEVATVDQNGYVVAKSVGASRIYATAKDGSGVYCYRTVTVYGPLVSNLYATNTTIERNSWENTRITYNLNYKALVDIEILNAKGQVVRTLRDDLYVKAANGRYATWNLKDNNGEYVPAGKYTARVSVELPTGELTTVALTSVTVKDPVKAVITNYIVNQSSQNVLINYTLNTKAAANFYVYNADGKLVFTKKNVVSPAGTNIYAWDYRDANGNKLPAGRYQVNMYAWNSLGKSTNAYGFAVIK